MNKKIFLILFSLLMMLLLFPSSILAVEDVSYDDNDFNKIQTFLNQVSSDGVKTNGECINAAYDANDVSTWTGVTWSTDTCKRVEIISWVDKGLAGSLDLSGFTNIQTLTCSQNSITSIDLSGATSLNEINVSDNDLTSLDIDANPAGILCDNNNIEGTLDLSRMTALEILRCSNNKITQLNIAGCNDLKVLYCNDNNISGTLDVSFAPMLDQLYCDNNSLSSLILPTSGYWHSCLLTNFNKLKSITSNMFSPGGQTFTSSGDGYISLYMDVHESEISLSAVSSNSNSLFYNWTSNGTEISTSPKHYIDPVDPFGSNLIANFKPALTPSLSNGIVYKGGRISITPLFTGGTWQYDSSFLQADLSDPNKPVFKGLKPGNTQILYNVAYPYPYETKPSEGNSVIGMGLVDNSITVAMNITIKDSLLPLTGQDFTIAIIFTLISITAIITMIAIKRKNKRV